MPRVILLCSILSILVFGIQFLLCCKSRKKSIKLIPVYIIAAVYAFALVLWLTDIVNGSGGVAIGAIFAFIISVANTVALIGDAIAWIVYKLLHKKKGQKP